jgi:membrane peptidoglycan carboxypeptidase
MGTGGGIGERVIQETAARELTWMMNRVVEAGTGQKARIDGWQIAGKTGTTQAARDAWFIGFSGDYVAGVWMGYDNNTPLTGVTGAGLPAEIWHETMVRVLDGMTPTPLPMDAPQGGTGTQVFSSNDFQTVPGTDVIDGTATGMSAEQIAEQVLQQLILDILKGQGN